MNPVASPVQEFLEKFRKGDRDAAFFGLLELDRRFLPELMSLFPCERDAQVRAFLVEILWQHREASTIPFLGGCASRFRSGGLEGGAEWFGYVGVTRGPGRVA